SGIGLTITHAHTRIDVLTAIREGLKDLDYVTPFDRIAIDHGLRHNRTDIEWATAALAYLADQGGTPPA
ncbi:hypothetical protein P1N98_02010, partial [Tsukamurella tyrosinosolvens]|uniref:hypothetical protein n=1 Tax=Tsukamurella tyrosinosolvens TaxID=57704 RepID=UPI002481712A